MFRRSRGILPAAVLAVAAPSLTADIGYVGNNGNGLGTTVSVWNTGDHQRNAASPVTVGGGPEDLAIVGTNLYVTSFAGDSLSIISTTTNTVTQTKTTSVGDPGSAGLAFNQPTAVAPIATVPTHIVMADRPTSAYLRFIDTNTNLVSREFPFIGGVEPVDIVTTLSQLVCMSDEGTTDRVWLIDIADAPLFTTTPPTALATISGADDPSINLPGRLAVDTATNLLYVTDRGSNSVTVIDLPSRAFLQAIDVGSPQGDIEIIGDVIYVSLLNSDTVARIDRPGRTVLAPAITGFGANLFGLGRPTDSASFLYVGSNTASNTVYLVDLTTTPNSIRASFNVDDTGTTEFAFTGGGTATASQLAGGTTTTTTNITGADRHDDGRTVNRNLDSGGATHTTSKKRRKFYNCYLDIAGDPAGRAAGGAVLLLLGAAFRRRKS